MEKSRLHGGDIFQLGIDGPAFKFLTVVDENASLATIDNIDPNVFDFLKIDEQQKAKELQQIVDTDAFRELQERARRLRSGEDGPTPEPDPGI